MIDEENETSSTVKEALTSVHADKWKEAIDTEMDRINIRKCFSICDEKGQNDPTKMVIKSKFVFKLKLNNDNKTYKHKVRMVRADTLKSIDGTTITHSHLLQCGN
jgi:hypothetical protein